MGKTSLCKKNDVCFYCPSHTNKDSERRKKYIKKFCTGYHKQPELPKLSLLEWDNLNKFCKYDKTQSFCPLAIL